MIFLFCFHSFTMAFSELISVAQKAVAVSSYFLCLLVILVLCDLYRKRHIFKFAKKFKGYTFYPVIGNGYHTVGKDIITVIEDAKREYGLPCGVWNGHDYHYITSDASEIKVVLNHPNTFNKGSLYSNFKTVFQKTLLIGKFDEWKKNRKLFARNFSQPVLNSFVDVFYEKACTLVEMLKDAQSKDVCNFFCRLSLENFCANVIAFDMDIQKNVNHELIGHIERLQAIGGKRAFTSYFFPEYAYVLLTAPGKQAWQDYLSIRAFIYNIIDEKRKNFKNYGDFRENNYKSRLMDTMLEGEGTVFTDEEIFREIMLFTLAALDTSGLTLAYTCTLLGMNPQVQAKVYEEVKQVVGLEGPISYSDLPNLKYTERAIFESMRLIPVVPATERYADADVDLGNKIIPAGTNILISVLNLHRSEAYWKDPLEYNPDRFLPEEVTQRDPYAFIPFSGGPRNCIGMKYAIMMMKTTLAHVIRNYEIRSNYKSVTDMRFKSFITMEVIDKLDCTFIPRNHTTDNHSL